MKSFNKWLRIMVFLPIPVVMALVNYIVDPANIFHDYAQNIVNSMVAGNNTWILNENVNERKVKQLLIEKMPNEVDCIAIGPSLIMGVRDSDAGEKIFYNLGESAADYYDILAQFGMLDAKGTKYKRVILCVDTYFFDENMYKSSSRNKAFKLWSDYMLGILDGKQLPVPINDNNNNLMSYEEWKNLFSVAYLQQSFNAIKEIGRLDAYIGDRWGVVDDLNTEAYYRPDGSYVYSKKYQTKGVEFTREHAQSYNIQKQFAKGVHLKTKEKETFEKLIQYLLNRNIAVELYLCPVAPSLWDRISDNNEYPSIPELEEFAHSMSQKYSLKITGSYNPYKLHMTDEDFYDCRHVRHELLSKYFDFN